MELRTLLFSRKIILAAFLSPRLHFSLVRDGLSFVHMFGCVVPPSCARPPHLAVAALGLLPQITSRFHVLDGCSNRVSGHTGGEHEQRHRKSKWDGQQNPWLPYKR